MPIDEVKKGNGNGFKQHIEGFRLITPILVTISIFIVGGISFQLHRIEDKLFTHLTNHDIHIPREQVVSKAEFRMHEEFSNTNRQDMIERLDKLETNIKEYINSRL